MTKTVLFKQMLEQAKLEQFFIGTGNPEAQILIIGKEAAIADILGEGKEQYKIEFKDCILNWERDIDKKLLEIENWNGTNYSPLYPYKGQCLKIDNFDNKGSEFNHGTSRTWYNYQKLINLILNKKDNTKIDFHEDVFITEINASPSKRTKTAKTDTIKSRKKFIQNSAFFQSFPVVIIAGLGYFEISENKNEVEDIFGVRFCEKHCAEGKETQTYWIHYSEDKNKLLINTKQLSMFVSDGLINGIAKEIKDSGLIK